MAGVRRTFGALGVVAVLLGGAEWALAQEPPPPPALVVTSAWQAPVVRLHRVVLDREPSSEEAADWTGRLDGGEATLVTVAASLLRSPEFVGRHGTPDAGSFVTMLYRQGLGREPDPEGLWAWTAAVAGGRSRAAVAVSFSESEEALGYLGGARAPRGAGGVLAGRTVALTFDDGPSTATPAVLDVLARYDVLATFFVVGVQLPRRAELVTRAVEAGHSVQNHTWSHPSLPRLSATGIADQLGRTSAAITAVTGAAPSCYRPPSGATSSRVRSVAASLGLAEVRWNVETSDYRRPSPAVIARRVLAAADGRPLVVLLHDGGGDRRNTVAALPAIIEGLRARGYDFVPLCR